MGRLRLRLLGALLAAFLPSGRVAIADCRFHVVNDLLEGTCGALHGGFPEWTLGHADTVTTGRWRQDRTPLIVLRGKLTFPRRGVPDSIEVEVYPDSSGIVRTSAGWYPISGFAQSADSARFQLDADRQVPPSELDRKIIQRADAILASEAVWDRADDRQCSATDISWSIYCALVRAQREVTGGFHHRRPAMELIRILVEARTMGRNYEHRLMGYNNDPTTTLADVRRLFADALARINP